MTSVKDLYVPHTTPFTHQWECLQASYNKRAFAYLMDPGLGKTKVSYDLAALWFEKGHITGLLILAPNDVHTQWIEEQLPIHLPPRIRTRCVVWRSNRQSARKRALELVKKPIREHLHILAMNHESLATKPGRQIAKQFLEAHPSLFILDDSHEFRTPKAARTRAARYLGEYAFGRRILTGTLTGGVPFNAYSQFAFLDPRILKQKSFLSFKHRYGRWNKRVIVSKDKIDPKTSKRRVFEFEELEDYQRLDELNQLMAPFVYSKHKEDCADLPPKMPMVVPTHLSPAQLELYNRMVDEGIALLTTGRKGLSTDGLLDLADEEMLSRIQSSDHRVSYRIKLTLMLRLQQIVVGFVKDDAGIERDIHKKWQECPRIADSVKWVQQCLDSSSSKVIVWANFRRTLDTLYAAMLESGICAAKVDGSTRGDARTENVRSFKDPSSKVRVLVAHPRTMGTGQNFDVASWVLFVTRSYSLFQRTQAEDRAHRLSSRGTVTVGDMVAHSCPQDQNEMDVLKGKLDLASLLEKFTPTNLREMLNATA